MSRFTGAVGLLAGGALLATGAGGFLFFAVAGVPAIAARGAFIVLGAETRKRSLEDIVRPLACGPRVPISLDTPSNGKSSPGSQN